jgi:hypothetical protein
MEVVMRKMVPLLIAALLVFSLTLPGYAERTRYRADLDGSHEVPPVKTEATGDLRLTVFERTLTFELNVTGLMSPIAASIHHGKRGQNGPPIAGLFGGPARTGEVNGMLAEGTITDDSLLGELEGKRVVDLLRLIKSGQAYVNILTGTFPDGEIRGQIK